MRFLEQAGQHSALSIDEDTFRDLYDRYWRKVYGICYHLLRDHEVARELSQDIFEALWNKRETLVIHGQPEHYFTKAAKLEVFQYIRGRKIRERHLEEIGRTSSDYSNSTQETIHYNELEARLEGLISGLPEKSKVVYQLNMSGSNHREIASSLKISEKTVEYHMGRIKLLLRKRLKDFL